MANSDVTQAFNSGIEFESSFIEFKTLVLSYSDLLGEEPNALIYTLERALERLESSLQKHQIVLAEIMHH